MGLSVITDEMDRTYNGDGHHSCGEYGEGLHEQQPNYVGNTIACIHLPVFELTK